MSERINPLERRRRRNTRLVFGSVVVAITAGAAIKFGPKAFEAIEDLTTDPSLIVAGVPGQIETYNSRDEEGRYEDDKYWLGIEQCPADVEAAKKGEVSQSYDPRLGVRKPECHFDWVSVAEGTFESVTLGNVITFDGIVGEPLRK